MTAVEKMHFVAPAVSTLGLAPCVQGAPDSHTHGRTVAWTREMNKYFSPIYRTIANKVSFSINVNGAEVKLLTKN